MKIEFILEEKILLTANYIKLIYKKDFNKIIIKKDHLKSVNLQFGVIFEKEVTIRVVFNGVKSFKNDYIIKVSDILVKRSEIILLGILNDPFGMYHQGYIDNFKLLSDRKEKVNWYELNDKQKYYYLRGCVLLSGVRETIDNINSVITIDLSKVRTDLDVYYEIGKSFFNSYGYFGTEFHSFRNCLYSINKSMEKRGKMPILKIRGHSNFKKYFEGTVFYDDFYNEFTNNYFEIENSK